jgi:hypothetical protein
LQSVISNVQSGAVNGTTTSALNSDANAHLTSGVGAETSTLSYDANGHASWVSIASGGQTRSIAYKNDAGGQVLIRTESSSAYPALVSNGTLVNRDGTSQSVYGYEPDGTLVKVATTASRVRARSALPAISRARCLSGPRSIIMTPTPIRAIASKASIWGRSATRVGRPVYRYGVANNTYQKRTTTA